MISRGLFKSKFAYRIFFLFLFSAVVPLLLLSAITFFQVSHQLMASARDRLHQQAQSLGMSIIERCLMAEDEIDLVSSYFESGNVKKYGSSVFDRYFTAISASSPNGTIIMNIMGAKKGWPVLTAKQKMALASGKAVLFTIVRSTTSASIFMYKVKRTTSGDNVVFMTELKPEFLLGIVPGGDDSFGNHSVSVIENGRVIYTTFRHGDLKNLLAESNSSSNIFFSNMMDDHLHSGVPIFLRSRLDGPLWSLVMTEPVSDVFKPVKSFKMTFALVILMTFIIIILLSTSQIRKYLVPLEQLRRGTFRISQGDLESKVEIQSRDEFEDLAESFNKMTTRIQQQFNALQTMTDIDRAILSEFDFEKITDTFITRIGDLCPCEAAGVSFRYLSSDERWMTHYRILSAKAGKSSIEVHYLINSDLDFLSNRSEYRISPSDEPVPRYLQSLHSSGMNFFLIMPITLNTHLMAVVFLASSASEFSDEEHRIRARQIADRVAVALSNAYLINELNTLNWGTLTALARVVDAKSPWTAGHSERVAAIASRIGESMGLRGHELDVLNKAGMLHDIGKVSTPRSVLDKNGKLTREEFEIIKLHPERGARILEPITPYAEMIPIILQHHERFDGKGYPVGIAGHAISLGARIMAVADTFDAMTSDRPYRPGMESSHVINEIRNEAGKQFDPEVVRAFLRIMLVHDVDKECA